MFTVRGHHAGRPVLVTWAAGTFSGDAAVVDTLAVDEQSRRVVGMVPVGPWAYSGPSPAWRAFLSLLDVLDRAPAPEVETDEDLVAPGSETPDGAVA